MKKSFKRRVLGSFIALMGVASAFAADPFPSKPIRVIVHSGAGGLLDVHTRAIAQKLGEALGQPLVIDNRVGAGGLVGFRAAKSAPADGYTLLAAANTITIQPALLKEPGYDPVKDFVGIGGMTRSPALMVIGVNNPANNVADYVAQAKANPGKMDYASGGIGSSTHMGAASFVQRAGINVAHVPYKGNSAAWPDLMGGRVGMIFEPYGTAFPMIRDGRLKAIGVTSSTRLAVLPTVPTVAEQGFQNWSSYIWFGLFAPAGTPKDIVRKLSDALRSTMGNGEIHDRFSKEGTEVMVMGSEEFSKFVQSETAFSAKLASDLNFIKE